MRATVFHILLSILIPAASFSQGSTLYVVDSVPITQSLNKNLNNLKKDDVHDINVVTDKDSLEYLGIKKADTAIFITTNAYYQRPSGIKKIPSVNVMEQRNDRWYLLGEEEPYTGPFINYYLSGAKLGEGYFKNGQLDGLRRMYYENQQLKLERNYSKGVEHGWDIEYYENGKIKQQGNFVNGKEDGAWKMYFPNGQLKQESTFNNGKLVGESISYYSTGKLKSREKIVDGRPVTDPERKKLFSDFSEGFQNAQLGNLKAAIKSYSKCIDRDPEFTEAYFARGTALLNSLEFDEARKDFDKAIELEPYYIEAYGNRAFCLIRKYQLQESKNLAGNKPTKKANIPKNDLETICHDLEKTISLGNDTQLIKGAYREFCEQEK